jgi:hypothetical protein
MLMTLSSAAFAASTPPDTTTPSVPTASGMRVGSPAEAAAPATGSASGAAPGNSAAVPTNIPASTTTDTSNTTTAPLPVDPPSAFIAAATDNKDAAGGDMFTTVPARDDLTSSVIGLDIYNGAHEDIGTIKDIAFGAAGVQAYIVGVGGFLGLGDHHVAVRPSAITLICDDGARKWHAAMDAGAAELKAAPEFKYPSAS